MVKYIICIVIFLSATVKTDGKDKNLQLHSEIIFMEFEGIYGAGVGLGISYDIFNNLYGIELKFQRNSLKNIQSKFDPVMGHELNRKIIDSLNSFDMKSFNIGGAWVVHSFGKSAFNLKHGVSVISSERIITSSLNGSSIVEQRNLLFDVKNRRSFGIYIGPEIRYSLSDVLSMSTSYNYFHYFKKDSSLNSFSFALIYSF